MRVLWFAWLRTKVGVGEETIDPPQGVATVADLVEWLKGRSPGHAAALGDMTMVRAAVNQDFAQADHPVRTGDEIAFFPPVTGG